MCGVVGVIDKRSAIDKIHPALIALQHRGQDAAGAAVFHDGFHLKKGNGLVMQVFNPKNLERLRGTMGIGHVRYPTIGGGTAEDAQPFITTVPYGIALAHNGNLVNYFALRRELIEREHRYLNSTCDAEVILNVLAAELEKTDLNRFSAASVFQALRAVYRRLNGSYATVAVIANRGFMAFRDPHGIKPLIYGRKEGGCCFASESVALDLLEYEDRHDVAPGHAIFIDAQGAWHEESIESKPRATCIFEYVYFARPDSVIDGIGVYEARLRLGMELGRECVKARLRPDVVIPIPDTARGAAMMVAEALGVAHREGLIKNRYIYRTFIMPTPGARGAAIRLKLNPIRSEIKGKKVLLVDDSLVRGTTSREIVNLVRSDGAREVYYALYSPPVRFPCVYGIDMQTRREFIARDRTLEEVRREIKADALVYQTNEGLKRGVGAGANGFCAACFTGEYPTPVPPELLDRIERDRAGIDPKQ